MDTYTKELESKVAHYEAAFRKIIAEWKPYHTEANNKYANAGTEALEDPAFVEACALQEVVEYAKSALGEDPDEVLIEGLNDDAARYRFLRDGAAPDPFRAATFFGLLARESGEDFDALIDAEMIADLGGKGRPAIGRGSPRDLQPQQAKPPAQLSPSTTPRLDMEHERIKAFVPNQTCPRCECTIDVMGLCGCDGVTL